VQIINILTKIKLIMTVIITSTHPIPYYNHIHLLNIPYNNCIQLLWPLFLFLLWIYLSRFPGGRKSSNFLPVTYFYCYYPLLWIRAPDCFSLSLASLISLNVDNFLSDYLLLNTHLELFLLTLSTGTVIYP
jgi:hypothetical protein